MCNVYVYAAMAVMSAIGEFQGAQGQADVLDAEAMSLDSQAQTLRQREAIAWKEASLSEVQAMDVRVIGVTDERETLIEGERVVSGQRAAYGASGVRVDSGVVDDVTEETGREAYADAMTIRANTEKEAYGYELQAWKKRGEARTYHRDAVLANRSARDAREYAWKKRSMSIFDAFSSGVGSAAGYKGKG